MFETILEALTNNGLSTVLFAGLGVIIALNYKSIASWIWTTIQAGAIVKGHETTIKELKEEVQVLREKIDEYNALLKTQTDEHNRVMVEQSEKYNKLVTEQATTIARLESRILYTAKSRVMPDNYLNDSKNSED